MSGIFARLLAWKGALSGAWLLLMLAAERLWPAASRPLTPPQERQRLLRNFALAAINFGLSPVAVLPLSALAASHALAWRPAWWHGPGGLVLDLLLLDGLVYWWHRANHEWPPLWRFHVVHHLDRFLDASSAIRFHFGEVLISAIARAGVILLLGFPLASILVFETLVLFATVFHHSNLRLPPRLEAGLARVVITPSIHWVHHRRRQSDTDSNYGTVFSFWDRMFASRSPTRREPSMPIGVEGHEEQGVGRLILRPFRGG
jgi:sterol desaturase/sphingolipid hydroxylase (fatty acid hydroxylase superfamily)